MSQSVVRMRPEIFACIRIHIHLTLKERDIKNATCVWCMDQNQSDVSNNLASSNLISNDFRIYLEQELNRRSATNPTYSLRAFARDLGVDSSFLSKLLNGKRSMTARTILALAGRLALSEEIVQNFVANSNGKRRRYPLTPLQMEVLHEIENQKLLQLLEWYHLAVLELLHVSGFEHDPAWISERLGISLETATQALNDLFAAEIISLDADGKCKRVSAHHLVSSKRFPRAHAVKKQIYEQAIALLPESIGDHSAVTVSVSEGRLREAFERIRKFRRELSHFLAEPPEKENVYQLIISLFPISKKLAPKTETTQPSSIL